MLGTKAFDDGNWQGYEQNDLEATVDLGEVTTIGKVTTHFLQDHHSWIFGPTVVHYEVSEDGKSFATVGRSEYAIPTAAQEICILGCSQSQH
jgi:hypothetical protein